LASRAWDRGPVEVKTHGSSNYTVFGPEHPALLSPGGGRGKFQIFLGRFRVAVHKRVTSTCWALS
jgi:hypothetical protein